VSGKTGSFGISNWHRHVPARRAGVRTIRYDTNATRREGEANMCRTKHSATPRSGREQRTCNGEGRGPRNHPTKPLGWGTIEIWQMALGATRTRASPHHNHQRTTTQRALRYDVDPVFASRIFFSFYFSDSTSSSIEPTTMFAISRSSLLASRAAFTRR
jgi:hypothetical protein